MSTSLRDQLLKAGLISQKQASDAERQQERQERHERQGRQTRQAPSKRPPPAAPERAPAASNTRAAQTSPVSQTSQVSQASQAARAAKVARDLSLNRRQQEKAEKKARSAQVRQLIEQHRLPIDGDEPYNFLDGSKIRRIAVSASIRGSLCRGEIVVVRHEGRYYLVPAATAPRIRERDESVFISCEAGKESSSPDSEYADFAIPDDLIW